MCRASGAKLSTSPDSSGAAGTRKALRNRSARQRRAADRAPSARRTLQAIYIGVMRVIYTQAKYIGGFALPREPDVKIILALPESLFTEVLEHRFVRRLPSRTEAIRRLLRLGLDTAAAQRAEKPNA